MPEHRRQRRVVYHTNVRLRAPGREHSVVARVQNLSTSGIFVTGSDVPAAGTEVLCRMLVGGQRCTIRGQVAWVRPPGVVPEQAPGAGIRFVGLSERDAEMLARLVQPVDDDRQAVDVWFEGLPSPIRSHAVIADGGLRISTRLPFLRLDSPVRVSFVRRGVEEVRTGTLHAVTLEPSAEDGIPRLQLVVSTPLPAEAAGEIRVAPPPPRGLVDDRTERVSIPPPEPSAVVPAVPVSRPPAPGRRSRAAVVAAASAMVGLVGVLAWAPWRSAPASLPARAAGESRPPAVAIEPLPERPSARRHPQPVAAAAPPAAEPAAPAVATPAADEVFIPVAGTTRGLHRYPLADPPGVAINLPRGRARQPGELPEGVKRVLVQRRGAGSHLRVFFDPDLTADVADVAGGLRVTVRPRRPPRRS